MKMNALPLALVISLAAVSSVLAADTDTKPRETTTRAKTKVQKSETPKQKKVEITGSYLKRDVKKHGQITDGPYQVIVLDSATISQSGAADLGQLLVRRGIR
jgi:hypothetical protein